MGTVRAPYPSEVEVVDGKSIVSMETVGRYVDLYNRDGTLVAHLQVKNPPEYYVKALRRVGSYDTNYRDILVKDWRRVGVANSKLPDPVGSAISIMPTRISWTLDGRYVAIALWTTSPGYAVYRRDGDTFTRLSTPDPLPLNWGTDLVSVISWTPDGRILVIGISAPSGPFVVAYSRTGDTLTRLPDSSFPVGVEGSVWALEFSPDGRYLAVGIAGGVRLMMYDRGTNPSSTVFTRMSDLQGNQIPRARISSIAWSPDMKYVFVGLYDSPFFEWYKRDSGGLLTKLSPPPALNVNENPLPTYEVGLSEWSPGEGRYLAVGGGPTSPAIHIYKRVGDALSRLYALPDGGPGNVSGITWSPDGRYLAVGIHDATFMKVYKVDPETDDFTLVEGVVPAGSTFSYITKFSPDGKHLAVGLSGSPFIAFYKSEMVPISGAAVRMDEGLPLPPGA